MQLSAFRDVAAGDRERVLTSFAIGMPRRSLTSLKSIDPFAQNRTALQTPTVTRGCVGVMNFLHSVRFAFASHTTPMTSFIASQEYLDAKCLRPTVSSREGSQPGVETECDGGTMHPSEGRD